jgi:CheY-like chemotaxis protein
MGGEIGVRPNGAGSEFWVELETTSAASAPQGEPAERTAAGALTGTVLYIEDSASNAAFMERMLEQAGVDLVVATDGASGLALACERQPDAIVLDMSLPDMTGERILQCLKSDPATERIPVIAVSADPAPDREAGALQRGAIAYATKPIELDAFLRLLESALR